MNIHTISMKFKDENGDDLFHSFDDFIETGTPMREDQEEELEDVSEFAWFKGQPLPLETTEVFAKFKDPDGNPEFCSLHDLNISGVPVDTETDNEMDLDSQAVFLKTPGGKYVEVSTPADVKKLIRK